MIRFTIEIEQQQQQQQQQNEGSPGNVPPFLAIIQLKQLSMME